MTSAATRYSRIRHTGAASRFVALMVVLAFALQSFVTQTHMHGPSQGFPGAAIVKTLTNAPVRGGAPADNSPLDCPFCQAIAHSGAFFAPQTPLLILPAVQAQRAALSVIVRMIKSATVLNWRSRAPPLR